MSDYFKVGGKKYLTKDGWLRAKMTMVGPGMQSPERVKEFLSGGEPEKYEFASLRQNGCLVTAIYRKRPVIDVAAEVKPS